MTREYLTLSELEDLAWEFRAYGVSILAYGDEWHLTVPDGHNQRTYRAERVA